MQRIPTGVNMTIFILFFGISMLDAFASRNWWRSAFWLLIAVVFLVGDRLGRRSESNVR
jgi:uncharacterized membrane protein